MIFTSNQKTQAFAYLEILIENKSVFEIVKKNPKRSLSQNSYLHLILSHFSIEFGYDLEYTKQDIFKRIVNKDLFLVVSENKITEVFYEYYKSTTKLDTKEMTIAIDRFRDYSAGNGLYLPAPDEHEFLISIQNNIEKYKQYL